MLVQGPRTIAFALALTLLWACGGAPLHDPPSPAAGGDATADPSALAGGRPPRVVQPGAPGQAGRTLTAAELATLVDVPHTEADVAFMQGMIHHHAQALDMVALMPGRTRNQTLRQLGLRIEISQRDEIALMGQWLRARRAPVPDPGAHAHMGGRVMMPGMLTPEQMERLAAATGPEFDRLFLELMIQHHQGAIVMVRELFAAPGGGQEPDVFRFATDVDADQTMEIRRMREMLRDRAYRFRDLADPPRHDPAARGSR
jgi:uncharacterized protein (DUF305 family)